MTLRLRFFLLLATFIGGQGESEVKDQVGQEVGNKKNMNVIGQQAEMRKWWCTKPKNEKSATCEKFRMMDASAEERKEWRKKSREKYNLIEMKKEVDNMHKDWCADANNMDTDLCKLYERKLSSADKTPGVVSDQKRPKGDKKVNEKSAMHAAWCDGQHADEVPCLLHRASLIKDEEARKELQEKLKGISADVRRLQMDAMVEFWCNDPENDHDEKGVCLIWKNRRTKNKLNKLNESVQLNKSITGDKGESSPPKDKLPDKAAKEAFKAEMDRMHEWYCTSKSTQAEESIFCLSWRKRLVKENKEEEEKLKSLLKLKQQARKEEYHKIRAEIKRATEAGDEKALSKAKLEEAEYKDHGLHEFNEVRRSWCEKGGEGVEERDTYLGGKESVVCERWRMSMHKSEL